jgi:MFS transporter, FHS family, glucose/mannose:H+ symporter
MASHQTSSVRLITIGSFLSFFLFGWVDNLKGPTLPPLLREVGLTYSQGGTLVLAAYVGFLVATLLTGVLSDKAGNKAVMFVACACLLPGMFGYGSAYRFGWLLAAMTAIGLGIGSIEVGGNLIIVDLYTQQKGRYLNLLAFFHGAGSMLAPLYAGQMLSRGFSWRLTYHLSLGLVGVLALYFLAIRYPRKATAQSHALDLAHLGASAFTPDMLLYYGLIAIYVAAEIGFGAWLVEFLQQVKGQSVLVSSVSLSVFFGGVTAGRFVGSFLVDRIGYLPMILSAALASIACVGVGMFAPPAFAFFLPATGLFFSIIFPTITASVSSLHTKQVGTILGLLFTFAGVGGMIGPWLVGVVSDLAGLVWGFGMILGFCVIMAAIVLTLQLRNAAATPQSTTRPA